ncbi:MAG: 3-keto-5-aminohexanoate cleavage protein [Aliishimia sp.]
MTMLQACLNGGRTLSETPNVPITATQLAQDAVAAKRAGAEMLHVHPRDDTGSETLAPRDVAKALNAIRAAVPRMPVGIGTGHWIRPGGEARHADMQAWDVLPDYVSVNLNEPDAAAVISMLHARGIGIEAGVWNARDARKLCREVPKSAILRVLLEMPDAPGPLARQEALRCRQVLRERGLFAPILLHGMERSAWPCLSEAARLGFDTRIGFEDTLDLPDGRPAKTNAQLIEAAREVIDHATGDVIL